VVVASLAAVAAAVMALVEPTCTSSLGFVSLVKGFLLGSGELGVTDRRIGSIP
jgi:hypothetical protein